MARYASVTGIDPSVLDERLRIAGLDARTAASILAGDRPVASCDPVGSDVLRVVEIGAECWGRTRDSTLSRVETVVQEIVGAHAGIESSTLAGISRAVERQARHDVGSVLEAFPDTLPERREAPVLARRIGVMVQGVVDDAARLADAWLCDEARVRTSFGLGDGDAVVNLLNPCVGDPHDGRKRSWVLDVGTRRVFFKQRDLAIDEWYSSFVDWFNAGGDERLRSAKTLRSEGYGWSLGVERRQVDRQSAAEVFRRFGVLLGAIEFLGGTDVHSSNVVVDGAFPVPVDLECLFHPRSRRRGALGGATATADRWLALGPLRTGILPVVAPGTDDSGFDVSALGGPVSLGERESMLVVDGVIANPSEYSDDILCGYRSTFDHLIERRNELGDPTGVLSSATDLQVRFIHRDTSVYRRLLRAAAAPAWHRSGVDRSVAIDRLWMAAQGEPVGLVAQSARRLFDDDIPRFVVRVGSRVVADDAVALELELELESPGRCLERLDSEPGRRQLNDAVVDASVRGLSPRAMSESGISPLRVEEALPSVLEIGHSLLEQAIRTPHGWSWIVSSRVSGGWQLGPARGGLYDGVAGVALAFESLAAVDEGAEWREAVEGCGATLLHDWDLLRERDRGSSPFVSTAAAGLYLAATSRTLPDDLRHRLVDRAIAPVADALRHEKSSDFIYGLPGLVRAASLADDVLGLDLAPEIESAVERLADGRRAEGEVAWPSANGWPLQGLGHGLSGVLLGLASLPGAAHAEPILSAIHACLQEEQRARDIQRGGWFDRRVGAEAGAQLPASWCNGASGIGLARLQLGERLGLDMSADIEWAKAVLSSPLRTWDDGLCHGWLGAVSMLPRCGQALPLPASAPEWRWAEPGRRPGAGLMLGAAGVLFAICRAIAPGGVPDVLTLDGLGQ
jgi:lantibiotic modifying enzyme